MTAAELIDTLEAKQLLSDKAADKLRKKIASSSKPLTAKSLARFLIEKGYISKQDVVEVLAAGGEVVIPPPEPSSTGEPSGVDLPMDDLQDMSSSSEWTMDGESGAFGEATEETLESPDATSPKKKKRKKHKKGNEWDSPLLLIGGGSLLLMVIVGTLIGVIMFAENADKLLKAARDDMNKNSYANAIVSYEKFVENYKSNAEYSKARVELAMARIRQKLEAPNYQQAFDEAVKELKAIDAEKDFETAEEDLSDMLPRIARGLAEKAEASTDSAETDALASQANKAMEMANNTKYVPKSRRDNNDMEEIRATLDAVALRQQSLADLATALEEIKKLNAAGDAKAAFAVQEALVEKHPTLLDNAKLAEALVEISATEQKNIHFVEQPQQASTSERESNLVAALAVANQSLAGKAPTSGMVSLVIDGVAYGIDAASGKVVWRRYTGPSDSPVEPLVVGDDVILIDWHVTEPGKSQQALMRLKAATGELVWRLELEDQVAAPVLAGNRVLLAGASGKLYVVDAASGTSAGFVEFSQPLVSAPEVDTRTGAIFLAGERSSLYSLSAKDLSCLSVIYTKHARGAMVAPPVIAIDKVAVVENDGADTCAVSLYATGSNGAITGEPLGQHRLNGRVVSKPLVDGRRITFVTDRGQVSVFEVSVGADGDPLTLVAQRAERNSAPQARFAKMLDGHVWLAESSLAKYAISPSGNRLATVGLKDDYNRSQFVAPLVLRDEVLIHARGVRRRAGFSVVASSTKDGSPYWTTDLGTPAAGNPLASNAPVALLEADANGQVYRFTPEEIKTRVQNEALKNPQGSADETVYQHALLLAGGAAVFAANDAEHALLYSPSSQEPLSKVNLAGKLACSPTPFEKGWLAPLTVGQVFLLDSATGKAMAAPFQPSIEAGRTLAWKPGAVYDQDELLLTDGVSKVYLLEVRNDGSDVLTPVAEASLSLTPLVTGFAVAGDIAVALAGNGQLETFQLPSLEAVQSINPGGRVVWGPQSAGDFVLLATATSLTAIDGAGKLAWQTPLEHGPLAGEPLTDGASIIVASQDGTLLRINAADGSVTGTATVGEPIAAGPVQMGNRLVVSARDGSLLVVDAP